MKKRNYRKRQYYLRDKKKQQPLIYEMLKLQKKIRFLRIIMKILSLHCFFFSAQNLLLYWKNKKMPSKEREDSFGNISSNINRWVAVAVLHPLGKRQPHVRSLLCFGFVFPPCCGRCSWLYRPQTGVPWRDSSLLLLLLLFCRDEIVLLVGSFIFVMEVLIFNYT